MPAFVRTDSSYYPSFPKFKYNSVDVRRCNSNVFRQFSLRNPFVLHDFLENFPLNQCKIFFYIFTYFQFFELAKLLTKPESGKNYF